MKSRSQPKSSAATFNIGDEFQTLGDLIEQSKRDGWTVIQIPSRADMIPAELQALDDSTNVLLLAENGFPYSHTASLARFIFRELIERTRHHRYSKSDLVKALSEQTGQSVSFFQDAIRDGYKNGQLRFWFPGGSPAECPAPRPDDAMGAEFYLGMSGEYTTLEAVNDWLEQWGATYRLEPYKPVSHGKKQPQQQELILDTIREMGHDPYNLPPRPAGLPGVKSEVKERLKEHYLFKGSATAFDTAWRDLRLKS